MLASSRFAGDLRFLGVCMSETWRIAQDSNWGAQRYNFVGMCGDAWVLQVLAHSSHINLQADTPYVRDVTNRFFAYDNPHAHAIFHTRKAYG